MTNTIQCANPQAGRPAADRPGTNRHQPGSPRRKMKPVVEAKRGELACMATQEGARTANVRMQKVRAVAAREVHQLMDTSWAMVVTTADKGRFLIRRLKNHSLLDCPFLSHDVRRLDDSHGDDRFFMNDPPEVLCPVGGKKRPSDQTSGQMSHAS